MTPNTNITALLVFASTRGYGEQEFAARLILAPKPRLVNSKHRQGAWLGTELSRQRCGSFLSKVAFETLVTPLIQKENPDPFTVKYVNSVYSARASKLVLAPYPVQLSRHNGWIRDEAIEDAVRKFTPKEGDFHVMIVLDHPRQATSAATAVARAFPIYSAKSSSSSSSDNEISTSFSSSSTERTVYVEFILPPEFSEFECIDYPHLQLVANGVQTASRLVDMPASELNTTTYLAEIQRMHDEKLKSLGVQIEVIKGNELRDRGFGGLWGVGKGNAEHPPALAILSYTPYPTNEAKTMCWVGKGIVFDTGGLSIKSGAGMCTMKADMGGSAAILAAFEAFVLSAAKVGTSTATSGTSAGVKWNVHALLCLAENSVDAHSSRPDDVLYMYSGKSVEINNTDAEGRLVLADGVAYATKHLNPDVVLDMATLTGAVLVATGKKHAGILSNDDALESAIVSAGKSSGDLMFPLVYAPDVLLENANQFKSETADMKNSAKDKSNAGSSCAGHFIEEHLVGDKWDWRKTMMHDGDGSIRNKEKGLWAHCDIAGSAWNGTRGTGHGVALLVELARTLQI